jgi:DNA-binding NtrC family response regulator
MTMLDTLSAEAREWTQSVLAQPALAAVGGVAICSLDGQRVICGSQPYHYGGDPCRRCASCHTCPVGQWHKGGALPDLSRVPRLEFTTKGIPLFVASALTPTDASRVSLVGQSLLVVVNTLAASWESWRRLEQNRDALGSIVQALDLVCKQGVILPDQGELIRRLGCRLRQFGLAGEWFAVIKEPGGSVQGVNVGHEDGPAELQPIVRLAVKHPGVSAGDYALLVPGTDLYRTAAETLVRSGQVVDLSFVEAIFVIPLSVGNLDREEVQWRFWAVFVAYIKSSSNGPGNQRVGQDYPDHPPGQLIDHTRLFSHLLLGAWNVARRAEEADRKIQVVREGVRSLSGFADLVGDSAVMRDLCLDIFRIGKTDSTVLLVGEPGTGKELVARLIHQHSPRSDILFVCRRVAEELRSIEERCRGFYPAGLAMTEVVGAEFRQVVGVQGLFVPGKVKSRRQESEGAELPSPGSHRRAGEEHGRSWFPKDTALEKVMKDTGASLPAHLRLLFARLMQALYQSWQQDRMFNFFEFDSGAAATEHLAFELFGVPSESFTGVVGRPGRFQTASHCGGTLFLDNIHHLPMAVQKALLKATEVTHLERSVTRYATTVSEPIHVRLIAASIQDLREMVRKGEFLAELAFRLMPEVIRVPPLRERREDIPLLAAHFVQPLGCEISPQAVEVLMNCDWRESNVRGLRAVVESAATLASGDVLQRKDVERALRRILPEAPVQIMGDEERMIRNALREADGNVTKAAARIKWNRQKLYRVMKKYGITPP